MDLSHIKTLEAVKTGLDKSIAQFLETGVFLDDERDEPVIYKERLNQFKKATPIVRSSYLMRGLVRRVAKETKRPFVYARLYRGYPDDTLYGGYLEVPRRRYLEPVVSALLLISDMKNSGVHVCRYRSLWGFRFDADGYGVLINFLEQCRTNPEFRKALRNPYPGGNSEKANHHTQVHD